jgi:hypothetical protein
MSSLPPPFFSQPARVLHVKAGDAAFTGPDRLAREAAAVTLARNDRALADTLGRAWRSGAPDELLDRVLTTYAHAHTLDSRELRAVAIAARFVTVGPLESRDEIALLGRIASRITKPLKAALGSAQDKKKPCSCAACIAEAASLN